MDHDQRFKVLLQEFFADFVSLFFPQFVDRFDFSHVTWLDKEVFADPPSGARGVVDLVAQVATRQPIAPQRLGESESAIALVHVEVEQADTVEPFRSRMYEYYEQLRRRHRKPVLPIALYLRVGLDGIGVDVYEEHVWEHRTIRFEYFYVGLPALDADNYLRGEHWLGLALAGLMRAPQAEKARLAAEGLRRLLEYPGSDWQRFLLGDCLIAYATQGAGGRAELDERLRTEPFREVRPMIQTWYDEGMQEGRQEGIHEGQRSSLQLFLEGRFGPLSPAVLQRINTLPSDRLPELIRAVTRAGSLRDLGLEE
jgi:hypothetical protein